jgi:hypothetical protein
MATWCFVGCFARQRGKLPVVERGLVEKPVSYDGDPTYQLRVVCRLGRFIGVRAQRASQASTAGARAASSRWRSTKSRRS